jgi:diguanylate cyclase (GGDEF)-like protein
MSRADELELMQLRLARFEEEARRNEEAWRRSLRCEIYLLEAETLPELLGRLTTGLRMRLRLASVALALADPDYDVRHLLLEQFGPRQASAAVAFVDDVERLAPRALRTRRPWLGPFDPAEHGRLLPAAPAPSSVALLPLWRAQRVVGLLGLGSEDPGRFTPQHGTDFLEHLGIIAAFCLENTVNRARLTRSGLTDALTGWRNRRYLETRLYEEVARSNREADTLVCLMLDIDHFKRINDRHGHPAGDEVLRQVARRVIGEVRASDIAARYGGEEFVVLLPKTPLAAGFALAERIRGAVASAPIEGDGFDAPLPVTVSIGVAEHRGAPGSGDVARDAQRLLASADVALYDAKSRGRDTVALAADG